MCGICGIVQFDGEPVQRSLLSRMSEELAHRGPDAEGFYVNNGVGLAHRRLAIIDLSGGRQPLHNETRQMHLVANGEIYNYRSLRQGLIDRGHIFSTESDNEVILHLYEEYGEGCVDHLRGMFAFAIWDETRRRLLLARDRVGKKPLVYWRSGATLAFASELNALLSLPFVSRQIDPRALDYYFSLQYIPAPWTIWRNVRKLQPGFSLSASEADFRLRRYWRLRPVDTLVRSPQEWEQGLRERLQESVRIRLMSDVPVGAFLSGGLDSGAVTAAMSRCGTAPVHSFSAGFPHAAYNELPAADQTAGYLKTIHHRVIIEPDACAAISELIRYWGEPFADYSCIPLYYLAQFAARHVKVVLSGEGADEALGGYDRYRAAIWANRIAAVPLLAAAGRTGAALLNVRGEMRSSADRLRRFLQGLYPDAVQRYLNWIGIYSPLEKTRLYSVDFLAQTVPEMVYRWLARYYAAAKESAPGPDDWPQVDMETYLPGDLLVKLDSMTMAHGLEARAPFLDQDLLAYTAAMPAALKLNRRQGKLSARRAFRAWLPETVCRRKKQGFGLPIGGWLRAGQLQSVRETLLDLIPVGDRYLQRGYIEQLFREHQSRRQDAAHRLWAVYVFALWRAKYVV